MASCTGSEAKPESKPTTPAPAEPQSQPTTKKPRAPAALPTRSAAALRPGKAGVRAQVDFLVETLNYAMLTGDGTPLRELRECAGCIAYADLYEQTYNQGGMFRNSKWTVEDQLVYKVANNYYSFAEIQAEAGTYRERKGATVEEIGRQQYRIRVVLQDSDGGLTITGLEDAS
jgi:hypothetical protein